MYVCMYVCILYIFLCVYACMCIEMEFSEEEGEKCFLTIKDKTIEHKLELTKLALLTSKLSQAVRTSVRVAPADTSVFSFYYSYYKITR